MEEMTAKLSEPLRGLVRKLLQREPAERYATAQEAELALRASLDWLGAYGAEEAAAELSQQLAAACVAARYAHLDF
jgi:eukaryotic-like serine/threonine-protein kinase